MNPEDRKRLVDELRAASPARREEILREVREGLFENGRGERLTQLHRDTYEDVYARNYKEALPLWGDEAEAVARQNTEQELETNAEALADERAEAEVERVRAETESAQP